MSKEEAIQVLNMVEAHGSLVIQAKEMAIKALQEPIILKANEKQLEKLKETMRDNPLGIAMAEPKTGHWIDTGSGQQCSECGEIQYGYDNYRMYCAYCGAKMESEDKE